MSSNATSDAELTPETLSIFDTHCHLHGKEFAADLPEVIERAKFAGVQRAILIGVNADDSTQALRCADLYPDFFAAAIGVHPHDASTWSDAVRERLFNELSPHSAVVAIGEIGLDYHYDFAPKDVQRRVFTEQLEIAQQLRLPVVIHCREAYDELLAILREFHGSAKSQTIPAFGVLHCYFGTVDQALAAVDMGYVIGVGGASTFKKAEELHQVIKELPLDRLILETDAPYMSPVPYRGKRNEPAYLVKVAQRIAELKNTEAAVVATATFQTACALFKLPGE